MSLTNSKSNQLCTLGDLDISDIKEHDEIQGPESVTKASTPIEKSKSSSRVFEKSEKSKANKYKKIKKEVSGESDQQRLSISLTKREIEEDLYGLTGKRLLRGKSKMDKKVKTDMDDREPEEEEAGEAGMEAGKASVKPRGT
ncbi:hypothetical protein Tco_0932866 [Tanacetum coccineum]